MTDFQSFVDKAETLDNAELITLGRNLYEISAPQDCFDVIVDIVCDRDGSEEGERVMEEIFN